MKWFIVLITVFITSTSSAQVFTQTFVDRCTGEVHIIQANFTQGSATVAFYNKVRTFTRDEFLNGTLQAWLNETYAWWYALSPCSQLQQEVQQAQQTAQQAQQTAQQAVSSVATTISTPPPTTTPTNNSTGGTNDISIQDNTNNSSSSNQSNQSTESSDTQAPASEEKTKTEDSGSTESSEETTESDAGQEEGSSDEKTSEDDDGSSDEEADSEEGSDDESDSNDGKKSQKKNSKKLAMTPIQLRADMLSMPGLTGNYDAVTSFGANRSSIFGDVTYSATGMLWSNLHQFGLSGSYSKLILDDMYQPKGIDATGVSYMYSYGTNAITISNTYIIPFKYGYGTLGGGVTLSTILGNDLSMSVLGYNILYTNTIDASTHITYSPAFILAHSPITYDYNTTDVTISRDIIAILSNSFTVKLTRRFSFNIGWTVIAGTNPYMPVMNSFMIGAKLPF